MREIPNFKLFAGHKAHKTPVILSHLDWDHWAYAIQSGKAVFNEELLAWTAQPTYRAEVIRRPWLMREPKYVQHRLGPSHANLVHTLAREQRLYLYVESKVSMRWGPLNVIRCDDTTKSTSAAFLRNNEGLAVQLSTRQGKILVCGDADYPSIPARYRKSLDGIVAPHYGGAVTYSTIPFPKRIGAPMVASTGVGCYSSIPDDDTLSIALLHVWTWKQTSERSSCLRCFAVKGHVSIHFGATPPKCTCSGVVTSGMCLI